MNHNITSAVVPLALLSLALAGCASGDQSGPGAITPPALPPELASLHPLDGAQTCPRPAIGVDLTLTDATRKGGAFDPTTVTLSLDGADVTAAAAIRTNLTSPVSRLSILYPPPSDLAPGPHRATISYAASTGPADFSWTFTVVPIPCP